MNVLQFYSDRMEPVTFRGNTENVLTLRRGKSMSPRTIADGKVFVTELDTNINNGDIITRQNGEEWVIIARQASADCVQMQGRRINGKVSIIKFDDVIENYKKVGIKPVVVEKNIPIYFMDISASMKQYDAGLLPKTVKKILIRTDVDVDLLYRIVLDDRKYQIDNIDTAKYVNLYELQVSEDTRK